MTTTQRIRAVLDSDDSLDPSSVRVALYYDRRTGDYVPELIAARQHGTVSLAIVRRDLATNAVLPAIVRARRWAEELGLPCEE